MTRAEIDWNHELIEEEEEAATAVPRARPAASTSKAAATAPVATSSKAAAPSATPAAATAPTLVHEFACAVVNLQGQLAGFPLNLVEDFLDLLLQLQHGRPLALRCGPLAAAVVFPVRVAGRHLARVAERTRRHRG